MAILGLTTAASLWVAAGIGLAVGSGFVVGAAMTTVLVLVVLVGLSRWERRFSKGDGGNQQGGEHGTAANS
jgi:putative Mg2+ transporter-C (MgtC) family protein